MRTRVIVALFIAVCSNIPSLVAVGFARRSGQRLAIGARACESLGLSPIGDCEVLQVLHIDPAVFRGKEPTGTRHALSVFEEPGAARRRVLVAKELEGGAAVMSLLDQNGAPRRAVRRNNRTDAWLPFSLELNPAVLTLLGEVTYWLKQAKDAPK